MWHGLRAKLKDIQKEEQDLSLKKNPHWDSRLLQNYAYLSWKTLELVYFLRYFMDGSACSGKDEESNWAVVRGSSAPGVAYIHYEMKARNGVKVEICGLKGNMHLTHYTGWTTWQLFWPLSFNH